MGGKGLGWVSLDQRLWYGLRYSADKFQNNLAHDFQKNSVGWWKNKIWQGWASGIQLCSFGILHIKSGMQKVILQNALFEMTYLKRERETFSLPVFSVKTWGILQPISIWSQIRWGGEWTNCWWWFFGKFSWPLLVLFSSYHLERLCWRNCGHFFVASSSALYPVTQWLGRSVFNLIGVEY